MYLLRKPNEVVELHTSKLSAAGCTGYPEVQPALDDAAGPTLVKLLCGKATDSDGEYALCKELCIPVPLPIAGEPVCKEDEIDGSEDGRLRWEGENMEESALKQVRVKLHHLQGQPDPFLLDFDGQGGGGQSTVHERQYRTRHFFRMERVKYLCRSFHAV